MELATQLRDVDADGITYEFELPMSATGRRLRPVSIGIRARQVDAAVFAFAHRAFPWVARAGLFIIFFWFGVIKLLGLSEATTLAKALTAKTVGISHFQMLFTVLAFLECIIGVLCLIPRAVRLMIILVSLHMMMVCAPLVLVPERTWQAVLVPTMDGQYIIKNVLIVAATIGLAAQHHSASSTDQNV